MKVRAVVDRVEGEVAVLEVAGVSVDWPLAALPEVQEGDVLDVTLCKAPRPPSRGRSLAPGPEGEIIDL